MKPRILLHLTPTGWSLDIWWSDAIRMLNLDSVTDVIPMRRALLSLRQFWTQGSAHLYAFRLVDMRMCPCVRFCSGWAAGSEVDVWQSFGWLLSVCSNSRVSNWRTCRCFVLSNCGFVDSGCRYLECVFDWNGGEIEKWRAGVYPLLGWTWTCRACCCLSPFKGIQVRNLCWVAGVWIPILGFQQRNH